MKVMKRFLAMLLCVAMVATLFAGLTLTASAATVTGSFVKCTSLSDVTTGDYIIVGAKTTSSFGRLTYGTLNSSRLTYTQEWTSAPAGPLSNPDGASVWHLEVSGTNVTIYNAENSKYLNTGFSLATSNPTTYTIAYTSNYFTLKNGSNYIGVNKSANYWRTYGSSTLTNNGNLLLFKKSTKTLSSIAISSSNHRSFTTGATFVGETVTATYSDNSTATVNATFSGYNMSTAGPQTVTASYTEGGVTKTATYQITVTAPTPHTLTYSVNGDTSVISGGTYNSGSSVSLPTNVTAPADYTFSGWVASPIGTESTTAPTVLTGSYTMPAANTTLYALFTRTEEVQGGSSDKYELVTSASSLAAGDKILIVGVESGSYYALKPYVSGNNCGRNAVSAPVSNVITTTVADLTLGGSAGAWTLFDGTYYLYAAGGTTNNNYLKGAANANNANAKWTISFSGNNATIKTTDSSVVRHTIMHNTNNDIFSCYASGQSVVSIYKQQAGTTTTTYYTTSPVVAAEYDIIVDDTLSHGMIWFGNIEDEGSFEAGTTLTLGYEADSGYQFDGYVLTNADTDEDVTATYISGNTLTMPAFDVILSGSFSLIPANVYTVTTSSNAGGSISSNKNSAEEGDSVTITINPATHYHLTSLTVDGSQVTVSGNSYTFTMPGHNVAVAATFAEDAKYTVTLTQTTGGTLNASQTTGIYAGQTITLSANANTHYTFNNDWRCTAGGATISNNSFTMPAANVTITGSFTEATKYTVTFYDKDGHVAATKTYYAGETIPASDVPLIEAPAGFVFKNWYSANYSNTTEPAYTAPAGATVNGNMEFHAVYAELGEGGTSETFKLYITKSGSDYYIGTHGSNTYFATASTESNAIEFGVEDGEYLYCIDGGTKYYVYNTADNTTTSFTTEKANATKWTITDNDDTIQFQSKASGGRYLALNTNPYRFSTYGSSYSHVFTKIGGASVEGYTTNPVLENSHTVTWLNYDNTEFKQTSVKESNTVTAPAETPERPDSDNHYYEFAGWSETAGGTVVTAFPTMGANDRTYYAVFTENTYNYSASISGSSTMIVGQPMQLNVDLTSTPAGSNPDYTVTWSSSNSDFTVDENGKVTALAAGNATITATISAYGSTYTATKYVSAEVKAVFTLMTPDNQPIGNDWSGEYVIAGRVHNIDTYANNYVIFDASNSNGILNNTGNVKQISSTGINLFADGSLYAMEGNSGSLRHQVNGEDLVLDNKMVDVNDDYIWVIERIDDVNNTYTIKEKKYDIYLAADSGTSNTIAFSPNATDEAQWKFETWILNDDNTNVPTTGGSYRNEIVVIRNVKYEDKLFLYNTWASQSGQNISYIGSGGVFRTYSYESYGPNGSKRHPGDVLGYYDNADDQVYNIYLFGNPNPFTAQIFYQGDQKTIVNAAEVQEGKTAELTGLLTPDIEMTLGWSLVSGPTWEITSSTDNSMSINYTTGVFDSGSAVAGDYAFVTLSYVVHDDVNGVDHTVSTQAKVVITPTSESYVGVIFEDYSTDETENTYTVVTSVNSLPLDFYIHEVSQDNTVYHDGRTTDPAFTIVPGTWSATSTNDYTVSVDANGVLDLSHVTGEAIITVTHSGATANSRTVPDFTYKVYVKDVGYTLTVVPTTDSLGTYDVDSDTITVAGNENSAHLTFNVVDDLGNGPSASTFTVAGYAWTISGDAQGALINSNGVLDFSEMDRTEDHTITAVVYRATATDVNTGVMKTGLTDTITIEVKARTVVEVMEAVNDLVIVDYALPVTFNVLTNDNINVTVDVTTGNLPTGVAPNGSGSFTFTPSGWQTTDRTFDYTVAGIVNGSAATDTATVTLKTADSVYYEDTYSGIFTFTGNWTTLADGDPIAAQTSSLDTADIFEHDANYESYAQYSGGTAKKTTVTKGNASKPSVSFTFAGTGFDVISATTNNGGAVLMTITDVGGNYVTDPVTHRNLNAIYDNFRGYVYCEEAYTRYTLDQVKRCDEDGTANPTGGYYYDSDNNEYKTPVNGKWYTQPDDDTGVYYTIQEAANVFASYESASGTYIIKEVQSHWKPYEKAGGEANAYNTNYYQIPIMKITGLPYGTYTVTLKPTYSSAYDHQADGSYDFIFDGVRIHNPVANRDAEYKYISIHDAVKAGEGFGSGKVVACDHVGQNWSDWTFYSKAKNTASQTTTNRGSFVQYCSYCGGIANTAYFHVAITADNTELGVGGYNSLPASTMLRYTLTADACANQAAIQAKLDALTGSLTEYWSSNTGAIMTCTNNSSVVIANGEGTTYATLQLKDPATQTVYASAIRSPMITVYADETHVHTFGDWTHDADSDPSTHTHTCTGENCSFYETESCVFTEEVTLEPTQTTPGSKTCTCATCGHSYVAEIPALGGHTATFHVPAGATAPAAQTGNSVTMPAAVAAPAAFDAHNYTFVGWVESTVSDTTTQQTFHAAGTSINLSANTDFYALYTYEGEGSGNTYKMVTSEPANWEGKYIIVNPNKDHAMSNTLKSGSNEINASAITVTDNKVVNPSADLIWELTKNPNNASQYSLYNATGNVYAGITGGNSTNASLNSTVNFFTIEETGTDNVYDIASVTNSARCFSYYGTNATFRTYAKSANNTGYLFKQAGALTYTTNLAATCKHTNTTTTTVDATCTVAGSETVTCDNCGETVSVTPIAALGHYYVPTPAAGGTTYTCSRCGDSYFEADEFEVSYVLQPGVTVSGNSREGNAITLPTTASIPATYNAQSYTLVGWANATSADSTTNPTVYEKGAVVNINADTTFYPVYSYGGGGTEPGDYKLVESALAADAWAGKYLIAYSSTVFMDGSLSGKAAGGAQTHVSPGSALSNNTVTKAWGDQHYLELEAITDGGSTYVLKTSDDTYIYQTTNKNGIADSANKNTAAAYPITVSFQSSTDVRLALGGNASGAVLRYNTNTGTSGEMFRFYKDCGQAAVYLYKQEMTSGSGSTTTTYTFELKAASDSYAATLTPATLNMTTGSTASLTATLTNNGAVVTAQSVAFSSSNDNIVLVDENTGYLVAGETAGTATITATVLAPDDNYYYATCAVTVKEQSDNVTVNYIGSASGYVKNWGTRGTTATFLTEMADNYYTGSYSYETLSALTGSSTATAAAIYQSSLGTAIHSMLAAKQTSATSYDGTRTLYAYTDCVESGNKISSYYSAALVGPAWDSGNTWNREHTWPDSKGLNGSDENDIMMLRPTSKSENSSRGNTAYGKSSGYYDPNKHGQNLRGDVARLMLQHLMRWGNTNYFYGSGGVMESRAVLLEWLEEDPVDTWELGRNDAVQRITGVRNVFVDYPELAFILLGEAVPANYTTPHKSGIVAAATYSASAGSDYEPVTEAANTPHNSPRATAPASARTTIATGSFNGAVIIDGKGTANTFDDFAAYGPEHGVYLAPGQGIVFSLVSDIAITSQDLQIGAKAVNGTATAIDVASISNGTESTGIKYLLEGKAIASATEMYYELDTTQMGWNGTESSVLVIYNSGSGVLDVTNIRYSTVNGNTLTININDVASDDSSNPKGISKMQMAIDMIRIVYGEPITDPDPIEPSDLGLNFKSAELVLNSDIAINFNVEEEVMDSADDIYAVFTKALYNEAGEITGYYDATVNEATYNEETGKYTFRFTGINPAEMGSAVTAQLFGYRDGELVSGNIVNYSVLTYINNMYGKVNDADFRALIADLAAYGAAAQNYISYNTANLVTDATVEGLDAYATKAAPELNNATAIEGSGAVKFTGAYLSLRERITVCYTIDASEYSGNVADLELRIFDGSRQIGTAAFKNVNGKYVASFSDLNALQMRTVLTAEVYEGDTCVSTTLDYSIESYAAGKAAGNDALAALVNAMMSFGISAETYFAK